MGNKSPEIRKKSSSWLLRNAVKAVIILAAIAILTAIIKMPSKKQEAPATEAPPVNVTVMNVTAEPQLADTFDLPAVVEPNRIVTVSSEVSGRIERIPLEEGNKVSAGDLLIQLNTDLILPEFESAKAQVERDQIEFERITNLAKENAATQRELDNATSQLAISKARLEGIRARLERTSIFAPTAGEIFVNIKGEDERLEGIVTFISELADPKTRSTRAEITLNNEQRLLRSGQIVHVGLTRRILKDAVLIPLLAVIPMEDGKAVYVVNSSQAKRRDVKLGIIRGDQVQIESGLEPGDKLIIAGHRFVAPGQKVNIVPEKK